MDRQVLFLEIAKKLAVSRGGECLSEVYVKSADKLRWKCSHGHEWEDSLNHVKDSGRWCPTCSDRRASLSDLRTFAEQKGGQCLAEAYKSSSTKVSWRCAAGHEWEATWHSVHIQKNWCKTCTAIGRRLSLDIVQQVAVRRGGKCLTVEYKSNMQLLDWQCAEGHTWKASYSNVSGHGRWCPQCACDRLGRQYQITIEDMQKLAQKRGGECLSEKYVNAVTPLRWRCAEGHEWNARPTNVKNNKTWCPDCLYKGEREVRNIFERLTSKRFPSRTSVLSHRRYQLDGYCAELRIAFEHHGKQHYQYVPYFHRNGPEDFKRQQEIDAEKEAMCHSEQIVLIVVPYYRPDREAYIRRALHGLF